MTQQPVKWLVTVPEDGPSFLECLTRACEGSVRLGVLLQFFLGRATFAIDAKQNPDEIEYVRLKLCLDDIIKWLNDKQRGASKQAINKWMSQLNELGYIDSNGNQHRYDVYFHKIVEGIKNPPPKKVVLRGRHAAKKKLQEASVESAQESSLNSKPESPELIPSQKEQESSVDLSNSYSPELIPVENGRESSVDYRKLGKESSVERERLLLENQLLSREILNLTSKMLEIESRLSSEQAAREALEAKIEALNILVITSNNISNTSVLDEPANVPAKPPSRKNSRRKPPAPAMQPALPQEPEKPPLVLSEQGQIVWDAWCNQPWFTRARPKLTETVIGHCNVVAQECDPLPTTEEMVKARNWYQKKYKDRQGWHLGNFRDAYPQWLSDNYKQTNTDRSTPAPAAVFMDQEQANQLAIRLVASAQKKGHTVQAQSVAVENGAFGIEVQWNTPLFEKPVTFKSEKRLQDMFKQMCSVWNDNKKNDRYSRKEVI